MKVCVIFAYVPMGRPAQARQPSLGRAPRIIRSHLMVGYVHWPEAPAQHVDLNGRYRGYGEDEQYSNYTTKRHKSHPDFLLAVLTIRPSDAMCSAR